VRAAVDRRSPVEVEGFPQRSVGRRGDRTSLLIEAGLADREVREFRSSLD